MESQRAYFNCCNDKCQHGWIDPHQEIDRLYRSISSYQKELDHRVEMYEKMYKTVKETNEVYEMRMLTKQHEYDLLIKDLIILRNKVAMYDKADS